MKSLAHISVSVCVCLCLNINSSSCFFHFCVNGNTHSQIIGEGGPTSSGSVNPVCWSSSSAECWTCWLLFFFYFKIFLLFFFFFPSRGRKQITVASRNNCLLSLYFSVPWLRSLLELRMCVRVELTKTQMYLRQSITDGVSPLQCLLGMSVVQRDLLLCLLEAGFSVISTPTLHSHSPSLSQTHTHTRRPLLCSTCGFH